MYFVGIDLGTSSVKLLLLEGEGTIVKTVSKSYPISFPKPGWSEQNPEDWYEKTVEGLKLLLSDETSKEVAGIAIAGQMHGLVMLDENDQILRPAILWNDGRSEEQCKYLNEEIGKETISEYTGNIAFAGFTAPKLMWVRKHEPDIFKRIHKIMLPKDYLIYRMTKNHATDVSDASGTLYFDVKNRCWSKPMCDLCGITENQLPKVYESYEVAGTLLPELCKELNLTSSVVVAAGAGDNAGAAIGTGTTGNENCTLSIGTSGTMFISLKEYYKDSHYSLHSFAHADGTYHLLGCMLSAASCNAWWMDEILNTKEYEKEQQKITKLGENNVFFLPYLMGERCPHNDPKARGTFIGMTMDTKREDMIQAVLEGVAFGLRDAMELAKELGIHIKKAKLCGGGAKSPLWTNIIANVLNITLETVEAEEGPALGAAMLAGVAAGYYETVKDAQEKTVRITKQIKPQEELAEKYEKKYQLYKEIYPACKTIYDRMEV